MSTPTVTIDMSEARKIYTKLCDYRQTLDREIDRVPVALQNACRAESNEVDRLLVLLQLAPQNKAP